MKITTKVSKEINFNEMKSYPFKLGDTISVPVDGDEIDFSVAHVKKNENSNTVYFISDRSVGESTMLNMDKFLSDFEGKIPKELVDIMEWQEHSRCGYTTRRKLTIPSLGNIGGENCIGKDDIPFDKLLTEKDRVRASSDGNTDLWWLDSPKSCSPIVSYMTDFGIVIYYGYFSYGNAGCARGVVFGFSIECTVDNK